MAVSAQQALYEVLFNHLRGVEPWGERVEPLQIASARLSKPYCVFFLAVGARLLVTPPRRSARLTLSVKLVALSMAAALSGQEAITERLHNSGSQDVAGRLPGHADWHVLTVTEGRAIWLEEKFEGAQSIYHAGHQYEFLMEAK